MNVEGYGEDKIQLASGRLYSPAVMLVTQLKCNNTRQVVTVGNLHAKHLTVFDVQSSQVCL